MQRKRVAIVVKYFFPIKRPSGISNFLFELADKLSNKVDLSIVSYKYQKDDIDIYDYQNYKIYKVKKPYPINAALLAKKIKPDIVLIFSGIHQPIFTAIYFGLLSFLVGKKQKIFCQATNYSKNIHKWYYNIFLKQFNNIIATNQEMHRQYREIGCKSNLITPGVNLRNLDNALQNKVNKSAKIRIGFFGHFSKIKGSDRLLDAFLKIDPDNAEVIFAGGKGILKEKIENIAKKDKRIKIIKWQENVFPTIASCDFIVLPYLGSGSILGYSQSALEAMYLKVPVIGTPTPALEPIIKNGYNGYIVNNDNELEEKIRFLIGHHGKINELGENARKYIIYNFDIQKIANEYLELIYAPCEIKTSEYGKKNNN